MGWRKSAAGLALSFVLASAAQAAVSVPRLSGIQIDGQGDDWRDGGAKVDVLFPLGKRCPAAEFDANFRLAWDERGLLLLANVKDAVGTEIDNPASLWRADCVELFVADTVGGRERVQFLVAPGMDGKHLEPRVHIKSVSEALKTSKLDLTVARIKTEGGYALEVLIPWAFLNHQPGPGDTFAFQLYANSNDDGTQRRLVFFPKDDTARSSESMRELVLSEQAATHVPIISDAKYDRFRRVKVDLLGSPAMVGKLANITLFPAGRPEAALVQQVTFSGSPDGRSSAKASFPIPSFAEAQLAASVDGHDVPLAPLSDLRLEKAKALQREQVIFRPAIFSGAEFPQADFANPELAEALIGPYEVECSFYDENFEPVSTAAKPGRYGAVVEIRTEDGRTLRRFCTLYRMEKELEWWRANVPVRTNWPAEIGLDRAVVEQQAAACDEALKQMLVEGAIEHGMGAELFAGLREIKPGSAPANIMNDPAALDRAWWVDLKRKLYGTDKQFKEGIDRPRKAATTQPTPVLRHGTDEEAGFKPGTSRKLEALLRDWADNSDEGFTVCVARNGIKIIDAAYGMRDGKPMTTHTPSILQSITKSFSGSAIMMAVDQGVLSLDDTADKFLPPFRTAKGRQPTLRQLFTHTAGMEGHWGDEYNDFEEVVAERLPYYKVGQKHAYNGASLALGCKILEQVSGESLPEYYAKHLIGPLGMQDTTSNSCSWRTYSTAADLAKLGQMLMNGGSYGDQVFFSKETFAQMLPHKLEKELSPDTQEQWGIGLSWMNEKKTFWGHGSASDSTFFVSPERGLVITMARNAGGRNLADYHKRFIELIEENVVLEERAAR